MIFRKIIKQYPDEIQGYLLGLAQSDNANLRCLKSLSTLGFLFTAIADAEEFDPMTLGVVVGRYIDPFV